MTAAATRRTFFRGSVPILLAWLFCGVIEASLATWGWLHESSPYPYHGEPGWPNALTGFDTEHYVRIARKGYTDSHPYEVVFFPLYPLLIRAVAPLVGFSWGSLAVSWAASLTFFAALHRWTRGNVPWYLVFSPVAVFLFCGYSESLFLALSAWAGWLWKEGRYPWAAFLLGLAGLTRNAGDVLIAAFFFASLSRVQVKGALWCIAAGAIALLYPLYLWQHVGDPLAFMRYEAAWSRTAMPPWMSFLLDMRNGFWQLYLLHWTATAFATYLAVRYGKQERGAALFVLLDLFLALSAPIYFPPPHPQQLLGTTSLLRYIGGLYPLYIWGYTAIDRLPLPIKGTVLVLLAAANSWIAYLWGTDFFIE
ncbi:MAG: hypothetical protein IMW91_07930 [Firmicutes bacterium]|nr:hypothetical protein [Bacillota bacterium]